VYDKLLKTRKSFSITLYDDDDNFVVMTYRVINCR